MRDGLPQPDADLGQRCSDARTPARRERRRLQEHGATCPRRCGEVDEDAAGLAERAEGFLGLFEAPPRAELEHRKAEASRAVHPVLRRATLSAELHRGRRTRSLCFRMPRQSVLACCGHGLVGGGHRSSLG
eukprot:CAMPEP_0180178328 /NCGR_PEP_ID=MMETSP0986-20121125/38351_1 /TAXON_ID=697907 /ORGANISM="non described non described, Strain CCMP2293" /LENGTH=130 /DNA_ID=CAMNT_0022131177 /DNA_START=227 /DNA_END=619 /DNA_ORIENTATION=-